MARRTKLKSARLMVVSRKEAHDMRAKREKQLRQYVKQLEEIVRIHAPVIHNG